MLWCTAFSESEDQFAPACTLHKPGWVVITEIHYVCRIGQGELSVMAMPHCGEFADAQFAAMAGAGISKVVCLLEQTESAQLGLHDEALQCEKTGLRFQRYPVTDMQLPTDRADFVAFVRAVHAEISSGQHIAVHCRAGIGRTGMLATGILVCHGATPLQAIEQISTARGEKIPDTEQQKAFIVEVADLLRQ